MIHSQWVLSLILMIEVDYKEGILHLCVAFWLFITVKSLEIMLIWYDIWWSECKVDENRSATKSVYWKEAERRTVSPSPLPLTSALTWLSCTLLEPSQGRIALGWDGLGCQTALGHPWEGIQISLYHVPVSLPPCVALIETPWWGRANEQIKGAVPPTVDKNTEIKIFWMPSTHCSLLISNQTLLQKSALPQMEW